MAEVPGSAQDSGVETEGDQVRNFRQNKLGACTVSGATTL
jgi:hypothetical protein